MFWTTRRAIAGLAIPLAMLMAGTANAEIRQHEIKFAAQNNKGHPQVLGMEKFAELMKAKSGGKIVVNLFPGGVLGGDVQTVSAVQGGIIHMTVLNAGILQNLAKPFASVDLPFLFADGKQADAVMDGPFGDHLNALLPPKGLVSLGYWELGFRELTNNRRPVKTVDDIKGLKIRVIQSPIMVDLFTALGANAVPIAWPELYTALETKTVDGQENPWANIYTAKFYEVQKYASATRHIYNPQIVIISKKFWDTLNADEQKLFTQVAIEARDYQRKVSREQDAGFRKQVVEKGMEITDLTPAALDGFRAAVKPVVDKYAKEIGDKTMKLLKDEIAKSSK